MIESEGRPVPPNRNLSQAQRDERIQRVHAPYHDAIDACLRRRLAAGVEPALIAIHSFTPVYLGKSRPWEIGIVFGEDRRLADDFIRGLQADPALTVGINQPYAPADQVYYTVERHAGPRGLPAVMIEIRNDEITDARVAPLVRSAGRYSHCRTSLGLLESAPWCESCVEER